METETPPTKQIYILVKDNRIFVGLSCILYIMICGLLCKSRLPRLGPNQNLCPELTLDDFQYTPS